MRSRLASVRRRSGRSSAERRASERDAGGRLTPRSLSGRCSGPMRIGRVIPEFPAMPEIHACLSRTIRGVGWQKNIGHMKPTRRRGNSVPVIARYLGRLPCSDSAVAGALEQGCCAACSQSQPVCTGCPDGAGCEAACQGVDKSRRGCPVRGRCAPSAVASRYRAILCAVVHSVLHSAVAGGV